MGSDMIAYIQRLELMAFFSGYPLIYLILHVIAGRPQKKTSFLHQLTKLLPFAYALTGTLFLGLILKEMYPDYSFKNSMAQFQGSYLKIAGMLALVFWIPAVSKKPVFSLLHGLLFFSFLIKDIFLHVTSSVSSEAIKNDMTIYTSSLLLNTATLVFIAVLYFFLRMIWKKKRLSEPF